ncbi:MAG: preprotein translocase subunit SecE [Alphaproteobacteria bacterium]|nr:preprotein translocase subunit SecE [Alphaproteobacteria bacterium]
MAKVSLAEFARQVRQEASKVTWASRKETLITTATVFVVVMLVAIFLFLVDQVLGFGVRLLFRVGG